MSAASRRSLIVCCAALHVTALRAALTRRTASSMAAVHVERARDPESRGNMWYMATCNMRSLSQVLDVGCGQGTHTIFLGSKGLQATGVDLSPEAIAEAEERLAAAGTRLQAPACRPAAAWERRQLLRGRARWCRMASKWNDSLRSRARRTVRALLHV